MARVLDPLKSFVRRLAGLAGLSIRSVGRGVAGVDLLHDACILLGDKPSTILFDVGANIGQTTKAMLKTFRSPRIIAFEPSPETHRTLVHNLRGRPQVTIESIAFGHAEEVQPFHVTSGNSVNDSLLEPAWDSGATIVEVHVNTIDHYCARHGIETIGLLKIDTQGNDLNVLHGARAMLDGRQISLFACEAIFQSMYRGQASLCDLLAFAAEVGYELVGFYEQSYIKNRLSYLDALFASPH